MADMETKDTAQMAKKTKNKTCILIGVSIAFILVAIYLLMSNEFRYNLESIDYYRAQYNYTKSMSSGYFGSHYRYLASEWKELHDKAVTVVVCHLVGAILSSIAGSIGLYRGIRNLRKYKKSSNDNDSN